LARSERRGTGGRADHQRRLRRRVVRVPPWWALRRLEGRHHLNDDGVRDGDAPVWRDRQPHLARGAHADGRGDLPRPPEDGSFDGYDPANISPLVLYLASDRGGWLTGQIIYIQGNRIWRMASWHVAGRYTTADGGRFSVGELATPSRCSTGRCRSSSRRRVSRTPSSGSTLRSRAAAETARTTRWPRPAATSGRCAGPTGPSRSRRRWAAARSCGCETAGAPRW
jgi:hypothetical protein